MAKQREQYFVGRIGNVSYYFWKDIPCMRTIPDKVHQCGIVKDNYKVNGASTRMGSSFRNAFANVIPFPRSFDMQTRFRGALRNWLKYSRQSCEPPQSVPYLDRFSFNEAARLERIFKVPLTLRQSQQDELVLHIPSFIPSKVIAAPDSATELKLTVIAACCDMETTMPLGKTEAVLSIPFNDTVDPAQDILLPLEMPSNSLTLVVVGIQFSKSGPGNVNVVDERWMPVQVIGGAARVGE